MDGPQKGTSREQTLFVYSAAEHRREALRRAAELWERLVAHLATRMEGPDRDARKSEDKVRAQEPVDASGLVLAGDLVGTARALARERDRNEALVSALEHVGQDVAARVRSTSDSRKLWIRLAGRRTELDMDGRLSRVAQEEISALEKDVLYLESLLDQQRLEELRELAGQLARDQRELAKLIEQFQSTRDPGLQEKILRQVSALRKRMEELARRMGELQKSIRDEHFNVEAMRELAKQQDMQGGLEEIEKLLKEGKTEEALAKLQQLQAQMNELQKGLDDAAGNMGGRANPELVKRYREFSDALKSTTEEQQQLAEQTKAVRDRYREQMRQRMKQAAQGLRETLQKKAEQVSQDYQKVGPNDLSPRADLPLEQAKSELENLRSALKSEDFDLAAEAAQRALRQAEEISRAGEQQRALDEAYQNPPDVREKSRKLAQRLEKDAETVRDIRKKLDQLFPPLSSQLGQSDRQKLQELVAGAAEARAEGPGPAAEDAPARADGAALRRAGRGGAPADLRPDGGRHRAARGEGPAAGLRGAEGGARLARAAAAVHAAEPARRGQGRAAAAPPRRWRAGGRQRPQPAEGRDPGRRSQRGPARVPQGPAGRDEAGHARAVPRPGEAVLRGAGEVRRALAAAALLAAGLAWAAPADVRAKVRALEESLDEEDYVAARAELERLRQGHEGNESFDFFAGRVAFGEGRYADAVSALELAGVEDRPGQLPPPGARHARHHP